MDMLELAERRASEELQKAQREMHSGAITEQEYEERYETIQQDFRLSVNSVLRNGYL